MRLEIYSLDVFVHIWCMRYRIAIPGRIFLYCLSYNHNSLIMIVGWFNEGTYSVLNFNLARVLRVWVGFQAHTTAMGFPDTCFGIRLIHWADFVLPCIMRDDVNSSISALRRKRSKSGRPISPSPIAVPNPCPRIIQSKALFHIPKPEVFWQICVFVSQPGEIVSRG